MRNCLVVGNDGATGGLRLTSGGKAENCTIVRNTGFQADEVGVGGVRCEYGGTEVYNCIVYFNEGTDAGGDNRNFASSTTTNWYNCCTTPALAGNTTCITNDPMFVNSGSGCGDEYDYSGNFRLRYDSLCIDEGTNLTWTLEAGATDIEGKDRIINNVVDMGAYESDARPGTVILIL